MLLLSAFEHDDIKVWEPLKTFFVKMNYVLKFTSSQIILCVTFASVEYF